MNSFLRIQALFLLSLALVNTIAGFQSTSSNTFRRYRLLGGATTMEPPTKERTRTGNDRKSNFNEDDGINDGYDDGDDYGDLEYLIDSDESREMEDPFHILLMGSTFEKPKVTVPYVSSTLEYVLTMPRNEATELSKFAKDEGMSCLGTWPREECLTLGKQLQVRDVVCRVVPYCAGGQRGWQAKDVSGAGGADVGGFS